MLLAEISDTVVICGMLGPFLMTIAGGVVLWLKADAAVRLARVTANKADKSHETAEEIKELAVKTEQQTNNRLSVLDAQVRAHEIKCIQNQKESADQQRQIAELKLALSEALKTNR